MLRRLATASRKEVVEAIVVVLLCWVRVEVKVREMLSGSLEGIVVLVRGEINCFCRRGRRVRSSVGSSGADMAVWSSSTMAMV